MKLWIRNQTRTEIMECNHLSVKETIVLNKKKSEWSIVANFGWVGTYESMERCLEIIDEIQKLLLGDLTMFMSDCNIEPQIFRDLVGKQPLLYEPNIEYRQNSIIVYEMPEE